MPETNDTAPDIPLDKLLSGFDPSDPMNEGAFNPDTANRGPIEASVPIPPGQIGLGILWRLVSDLPPSAQPPVPWGVGVGVGLGVGVAVNAAQEALDDWHRRLEWNPAGVPQTQEQEIAQIIGVFVSVFSDEEQEPMQLPKRVPKLRRKPRQPSKRKVVVHGFTRRLPRGQH